jgi:hypothetical protein
VGLPISLVPSPRSPQVERRARWVVVEWLKTEPLPGGMKVGWQFFWGGGVSGHMCLVVGWLHVETGPGGMKTGWQSSTGRELAVLSSFSCGFSGWGGSLDAHVWSWAGYSLRQCLEKCRQAGRAAV